MPNGARGSLGELANSEADGGLNSSTGTDCGALGFKSNATTLAELPELAALIASAVTVPPPGSLFTAGDTDCATLVICLSSEALEVGADEVGVRVAEVVIRICLFFIKSSAELEEAGVILNSLFRTISGGKVGLWLLELDCS